MAPLVVWHIASDDNDDDCVETQIPSTMPSKASRTVRPKDVEKRLQQLPEGNIRIGKVQEVLRRMLMYNPKAKGSWLASISVTFPPQDTRLLSP